MKPLISVIIPIYKSEEYLHRCVDSVLNQTYGNLEIILVNDGSPDLCPRICDEYAQKDMRIKVIHKENGGQSSARNAALDIMTGEFVTFLDSDDYLHHDMISILFHTMMEESCDLVQCAFIRGNENSFPPVALKHDRYVCDNRTVFYSVWYNIIICSKLYKSSLFNGIRMPLGRVNEDDAISWKLYYRAKKSAYIPSPLYYYYINPGSTMAQIRKQLRLDFIEAYCERIGFFRQQNDTLMLQLSQWRFCLPLMLGYLRGNTTPDNLDLMLKHYHENIGEVFRCPKVPASHKLIFRIFGLSPKLARTVWIRFFNK